MRPHLFRCGTTASGDIFSCFGRNLRSSFQVMISTYPAFTWYATSSLTSAIDSSDVADLCAPCATAASTVSHAHGSTQSTGTPSSHVHSSSAKAWKFTHAVGAIKRVLPCACLFGADVGAPLQFVGALVGILPMCRVSLLRTWSLETGVRFPVACVVTSFLLLFPGCHCALAVIRVLSRSRTGMSTGSSLGLVDSRFVRRGVSFGTGRAALPSGRMLFLFLCTIRFVEGWGEFERTGSFNLVPGSTVLAPTSRACHVLLAL